MTTWDLLALAVKRWAVTLLGAGLTGLAVFWAITVPPVYFVQVRVVLLPPAGAQLNGFTGSAESLIDLAGVVAREMQGADGGASAVSQDVTLVGEGLHEGYSVRHPNAGGQWQYRFDEPVLDVQAVAATPKDVKKQATLALQRVRSTLTRIQRDQGVASIHRVRTVLSPATPQLYEEKGSRVRAVAATLLTGVIMTLVALGVLGPAQGGKRRRALAQMTSPRPSTGRSG